jgi:hypothetical protein
MEVNYSDPSPTVEFLAQLSHPTCKLEGVGGAGSCSLTLLYPGNTKGGSIIVLFTSCFTGLDYCFANKNKNCQLAYC